MMDEETTNCPTHTTQMYIYTVIHYQTRKLQNCPYKVLNSYYIIMGNKKRDKHQETELCKYLHFFFLFNIPTDGLQLLSRELRLMSTPLRLFKPLHLKE